MSSAPMPMQRTSPIASAGKLEMKLEVVRIPVSDVDRAKSFYTRLGWRLDADIATDDDSRVVQLTPPGSQCSVFIGKGVTTAAPGSAQGLMLIVYDIEAARADLIGRGAAVRETFHFGREGRAPGPDPQGHSYATWASFRDPDGNGWLLQEVKKRLPGRVGPEGVAADVVSLTDLLRETEKRHGDYEASAPKHHWSGWYAAYIVAREQGRNPDEAAKDAALHLEGARR